MTNMITVCQHKSRMGEVQYNGNPRAMWPDMCVNMCMCVHMCMDMWVDKCSDIGAETCVHTCAETFICTCAET